MSDILVNTTTAGIQHQPAVADFRGTHYLVAWADRRDLTVKGQVLQADGQRSGAEFVVNSPQPAQANTDRLRPAATGTGSGPVVVWIEAAVNPPGPRPQVKMQRFDLDGHKAGPEIQVSTDDVAADQQPDVIGSIDGGCVVVWADQRRDSRIRAQRFGPDGVRKGAEFTVNTTEGFHESPIATRISGNQVVAWRSDPSPPGGGALTFRILDFEGAPVTDEIRADISGFHGPKAMAVLDDGRFVLAHSRNVGESPIGVTRSVVEARVFTAEGADANVIVSATDADGIQSSAPVLVGLPGRRFLLAWLQRSAETVHTVTSVRAKVFSTLQGSVGAEAEASNSTATDRFQLAGAAAFGGGDGAGVLLAWADEGGADGDPSDFAVRARAFQVVAPGTLV
ncbi:hypothetical protein [Kitasatospora sp. NPDC057015]|uniref:hypothetical protein n=1 Tax=Kitasatospora sp. NPDC057015 TaxID=3346001 RepID=UPI00362D9E17